MRLIVLLDEAMIADVVCGNEAIYLGSRDDCRVHLNDAAIADQQAVVYPQRDGQWVVETLTDACEVHLNDARLTSRQPLKSGDEVRIRAYTVRAYPEHTEAQRPRAAAGTSRAALERFAQAKLPPGATIKKADDALTIQSNQLEPVARANLTVANCDTVEQFMDALLHLLLGTFAAQRVWVGVRRVNYGPMEYEEGRLITGHSADMPTIGAEFKPRVLDRSQFVMLPMVDVDEPTSVLAGPLLGPDGTLGMVYIDSGDSGRRFDVRDLDMLVLLLHVVGRQLDAIFKSIARTRAAMIEGQVSVAHEVQARLTPRKLPQSDNLQFGAFREPGRERSGDIYDVVRLPNNLVAFMVAQTPATGALPAMLMAQAQTAFRSAAMHQDSPSVFLRSLNWMLYDGQRDHPLHCFTGVIEPGSGRLRYAQAGHTGAFIISARGEERPLTAPETPPPLGDSRNAEYALQPAELGPGETLVLFTPGVITAKNRNGETFGEERFVDILCDGFGQLASATLKEMLTDLRNFTEGGLQPDDITVILAHRVS